jgi:hypothetical protein
MSAFSKRHRHALAEGSLRVELPDGVRGRLRRLLEADNISYRTSDETGWNYDTDLLEDLARALCDLYGTDVLPGDERGHRVPVLVARGPGQCVFDALELFEAPVRKGFCDAVNRVLSEEDVPWRMLGDEIVLLDGAFARSELSARADGSISHAGFEGAASELRRARNHVVDGDGRGAVHSAGSSFESVLMALRGTDRGTAAKLLGQLNGEGYFDGLPVKLRERFFREVLQALPWMRNNLGGHGQGGDTVEVPPAYAQLAIDLAAAFSCFLIALKIDRDGDPDDAEDDEGREDVLTSQPEDEAVLDLASDFSLFAPASEDDIPF